MRMLTSWKLQLGILLLVIKSAFMIVFQLFYNSSSTLFESTQPFDFLLTKSGEYICHRPNLVF